MKRSLVIPAWKIIQFLFYSFSHSFLATGSAILLMRRLVFNIWILSLCKKFRFLWRGIEKVYYIRLRKKRNNKWMQFFTFMQRFYYLKGNLSIANVCILLLLIILSNSAIKVQCEMVFSHFSFMHTLRICKITNTSRYSKNFQEVLKTFSFFVHAIKFKMSSKLNWVFFVKKIYGWIIKSLFVNL